MKLQDKVAIVTGAASGFGAEIARQFVSEGGKVAVADINGAGAKEVAASLVANALAVPSALRKTQGERGGIFVSREHHKRLPAPGVRGETFEARSS